MSRPAALVRTNPDGQRFLGPYLLQECIGKGGTAALYKAKRTGAAGFEKQVVVKTILPELAGDPRFIAFFEEEAKLQAQLFHANIAQVQDFGVMRGVPFLELEVLSGWNAKQLLERLAHKCDRLPVPITVLVAQEACRGLAYAHAFVDDRGKLRPIIHRDISPANVMICRDGSVKLIDFGLASLTSGETLKIDTFLGKLAYMSPEQLEQQQLDRRADVFAFGAVLWELLTGQRLFLGNDDTDTVRRIQRCEIAPPSQFNRYVPTALDRIVLKALARDPADRFASAGELLEALEAIDLKPATRRELLIYLGGLGPETFATTCDSCGAPVPYGKSCRECQTVVDTGEELELLEIPPSRPHLFVVRTPPMGTPHYVLVVTPRRARVEQALASGIAVLGAGVARACEACVRGWARITRR
jgi:eukaryotic-like serine/threonine-protein kinase